MVKVEEDHHPAQLLAAAGADPMMMMSPVDGDDYYFDDGDEEGEDEETDSEGDGDARRGGQPKLKKGPWTPDEDKRLRDYVQANGEGNWNQVRINAGLNRCGKSCRLRWSNHLRPDLKKGPFDDDEVEKIIRMHMSWGNKWAKMAALLPGRTDNEIKNYWNTRLKRHQRAGLPIYPEYLVSQASNQDTSFGTPEALRGTKRPNESSQNVLNINDLINNYFDKKAFMKHCSAMNMGDTPCPSLMGQDSLPMHGMNPSKLIKSSGCIATDYNGSNPFVQIPDEAEKPGCSTSFNYGMTDNQLAPHGNAIISSHPILDGTLSTSWPTQRPLKTELPSVQYSNCGINNAWLYDCPSGSIEPADPLIESPGSLKSESFSSQNTGLDAIVHMGDGIVDPIMSQGVFEAPLPPPFSSSQISQPGAHAMWHSFSSIPGEDEIVGCPLGEIQASKSPSSSDAILAESKCYPDTSFTGEHLSPWADIGTMHDASLEASLLKGVSLFSKDHSISTHDSLIDGNSSDEAKLSTAGHGLDSFPWSSMPGACNMSDFPNI